MSKSQAIRFGLFLFLTLVSAPVMFFLVMQAVHDPWGGGQLFVVACLIGIAYGFGYLRRNSFSILAKIGGAAWCLFLAFMGPMLTLYFSCFGGALLHIPDACI